MREAEGQAAHSSWRRRIESAETDAVIDSFLETMARHGNPGAQEIKWCTRARPAGMYREAKLKHRQHSVPGWPTGAGYSPTEGQLGFLATDGLLITLEHLRSVTLYGSGTSSDIVEVVRPHFHVPPERERFIEAQGPDAVARFFEGLLKRLEEVEIAPPDKLNALRRPPRFSA